MHTYNTFLYSPVLTLSFHLGEVYYSYQMTEHQDKKSFSSELGKKGKHLLLRSDTFLALLTILSITGDLQNFFVKFLEAQFNF